MRSSAPCTFAYVGTLRPLPEDFYFRLGRKSGHAAWLLKHVATGRRHNPELFAFIRHAIKSIPVRDWNGRFAPMPFSPAWCARERAERAACREVRRLKQERRAEQKTFQASTYQREYEKALRGFADKGRAA